jgi:YggT family protein
VSFTIGEFANNVFTVYLVILLVNILLTWIPRIPYSRPLNAVLTFIHETAEPYLSLFRSFIKPIGGGAMAFDPSPIIAIVVYGIVGGILVGAISDL